MSQGETIASISTPLAVGGIAIIRVSGEAAIEIADKVFRSVSGQTISSKKGYTALFGELWSDGKRLDSSVATLFRAPKSYTGEDVVELSCHGGVYNAKEVLRAVIEAGARPALPGEFTKRAFLNGKLSLTQAEAVVEMLNSSNRQALNTAREQMGGSLYRKIAWVKESLLKIAGHLSAWVDYPEEDIDELEAGELTKALEQAKAVLSELVKSYDKAATIRDGIHTVIVGKPNVGKSTLMNLLSGEQKSIVTDIAGTTRDVVEQTVDLGEVTLRLADTAGIRDTQDRVEQFGVELAKDKLKSAALLLVVFDGSTPLDQEDIELLNVIQGRPAVGIINKNDLKMVIDKNILSDYFSELVELSAQDDSSKELLINAILRQTLCYSLDPSQGIIANERQLAAAKESIAAIIEAAEAAECGMTLDAVNVSIEAAIEALMQLSGEAVNEEIVNEVFSHFCVGK